MYSLIFFNQVTVSLIVSLSFLIFPNYNILEKLHHLTLFYASFLCYPNIIAKRKNRNRMEILMEKKTDFKALSGKAKVQYIWDYYRLRILVIVLVAAFVIYLIYHYATYRDPLLNVIMINVNDSMSADAGGFDEFLEATDPELFVYYRSIRKDQTIEELFHRRLLEAFNHYLIIGGMPECVASWKQYKDPNKVLRIQRELIEIYENDFSKHNGKINSGRILQVFRSIVPQLAKANEKFMYGAVREGARARDFEEAIEWLVSVGMLNRVCNTVKPEHPLPAFDKTDQFKLFLFDTGLLKCMAGIDNAAILLKSDYQFKGPLTENYVLQQLQGLFEVAPRYYANKYGEIDFVLQNGTEIIPVEVKAGEDKSAPSFKRYIAESEPEQAIRFSKRGYRTDGSITNIPLYLARKTKDLL